MKKNKMMRIASVLLVAVLISTCAISGTFAKYVTKVSGEDKARVAKWGIVLTVEGESVFADKYKTDETGENAYDGTYSVEAAAPAAQEGATATAKAEKVVAPGTSSEGAENPLKASVKGTPEVATRYAIEITKFNDVVLPASEYTDYTELKKADDGTYGYTGKFTLAKAYAPVKWNLIVSKGTGSDAITLNVAEAIYANLPANYITIAESYGLTKAGCSIFDAIEILKKVAGNDSYKDIVEQALAQVVSGGRNFQLETTETGIKMSYDFDPNKEMDFTFELAWAWAFETDDDKEIAPIMGTVDNEEVDVRDMADTFLGNIAAGVVEAPKGASVKIGVTLTASATQID